MSSVTESFWRGLDLAHKMENTKQVRAQQAQQAQLFNMQMAEYLRQAKQREAIQSAFAPVTEFQTDPSLAQGREALGLTGEAPQGLTTKQSPAAQALLQAYPQMGQMALGLIQAGIPPSQAVGIIPQRKGFTLKPGEIRYGPQGRPIARGGEEVTTPNYDIIENKAGTQRYLVKGSPIPAGWKVSKPSAVNITLGAKPASAAERTAIVQARTSRKTLDNLKSMFDAAYVGPVAGRAGKVGDLFGLNTQKQSEFNAATAAFKNYIIKQITGAQMSEKEATRILKQVPDVTNPPSVWKARWEQSVKNIKFLQEEQLKVLKESGLRAPGGIDKMSNEELLLIIGGE